MPHLDSHRCLPNPRTILPACLFLRHARSAEGTCARGRVHLLRTPGAPFFSNGYLFISSPRYSRSSEIPEITRASKQSRSTIPGVQVNREGREPRASAPPVGDEPISDGHPGRKEDDTMAGQPDGHRERRGRTPLITVGACRRNAAASASLRYNKYGIGDRARIGSPEPTTRDHESRGEPTPRPTTMPAVVTTSS